MTKAVSDGCLGECDQLGVTSQCEGITECTLSPQGFGVCTCPADTFGPPQCLGECDQLGVTSQCEGITECTLSPQGFGVCTCPADTFGPPQCLGECDQLGVTSQCEGITECTLSPQGFGVCTCPADTFGPIQCLDDCESNVQCNLRGNCVKGKCVCFSGFQGKNCEVQGQCDQLGVTNQCEGITECTLSPQGFGVCTCPADTFGPPQCLDDCESNLQCNFRGNCEKGKCVCFSGFQGKNCELQESLTTPESVTKKPLKNLPLLVGALTLPLLLLVPAGLVSAITSG
nr:tenascin-like [Crassostrea gigas]